MSRSEIEGCTTPAQLLDWCLYQSGSVTNDSRHYHAGNFTQCEKIDLLWRAARLGAAIRRGLIAGWIERDEGAKMLESLHGLPLDKIY